MQFHDITHDRKAQEFGEFLMTLNRSALHQYFRKHSGPDAYIPVFYADWCHSRRPYYAVYPKVIPMLTKIKLDIPCKEIQPPIPSLLIRLPVVDNPMAPVKTIFVHHFMDESRGSHLFIRTEYQSGSSAGWFDHDDLTVEQVCRAWEEKDKRRDLLIRLFRKL